MDVSRHLPALGVEDGESAATRLLHRLGGQDLCVGPLPLELVADIEDRLRSGRPATGIVPAVLRLKQAARAIVLVEQAAPDGPGAAPVVWSAHVVDARAAVLCEVGDPCQLVLATPARAIARIARIADPFRFGDTVPSGQCSTFIWSRNVDGVEASTTVVADQAGLRLSADGGESAHPASGASLIGAIARVFDPAAA